MNGTQRRALISPCGLAKGTSLAEATLSSEKSTP